MPKKKKINISGITSFNSDLLETANLCRIKKRRIDQSRERKIKKKRKERIAEKQVCGIKKNNGQQHMRVKEQKY